MLQEPSVMLILFYFVFSKEGGREALQEHSAISYQRGNNTNKSWPLLSSELILFINILNSLCFREASMFSPQIHNY